MKTQTIIVLSALCFILALFGFKNNQKEESNKKYEYLYFSFTDKADYGFVSTEKECTTVKINRSKLLDCSSILKVMNDYSREGWELMIIK